nr:unnamed protein product [Callosobruchus analis]
MSSREKSKRKSKTRPGAPYR